MIIPDARAREQALDPERSFIVQAPAGSGKTELLIQRYLALLARVSEPEEIISITFTRKAAAEMRRRILSALDRGKHPEPPLEPHALKTWTLALAVLSQNDRRGWRISENPSRLKIQTIDSLCAGLTRQMPCLSRFGVQPQIAERPESLYRQAARNTIAGMESGAAWSPAIEALVRHLDNHLSKIEALVAGMLARRDQWLRHVMAVSPGPGMAAADGPRWRGFLEDALAGLINEALTSLRKRFPRTGMGILLESARFAAEYLKKEGSGSAICNLAGISDLPEAHASALQEWMGLAALLLTNDGGWRKGINKNIGFPAPGSANDAALKKLYQERKDVFSDYLKGLEGGDDLAAALAGVRMLPNPAYNDSQWDILQTLFEILKVAAGHLELVFQAAGAVDFAEISQRAGEALGEPEAPTDLALALDYRISHILVDEFQDTSASQFYLLERLTSGWMPGDGRTVFAVGDPMQSIYGFREAEVGLFLHAWENGLGTVDLKPLRLSVNFRSQKGVIDWVNERFPKIMPSFSDITIGRVPYTPSDAFHPALPCPAVTVHPFVPADKDAEAAAVADCVKNARQQDPDGTIAILVRGRTHLAAIIPALKHAAIPFQAVEIDSLESRPVINDLITLTRALLHLADRIAWLAVLRAPMCGLSLHDLHALAGDSPGSHTILDLMNDSTRVLRLSSDGQARLIHVRGILMPAVMDRQRKSLRRAVEVVWLALGGPACVFDPSELEDVDVFLDLIDRQEAGGKEIDAADLEDAVSSLYARPDTLGDAQLQIMTIHKAKGLEFDTVIVPALEKKPPSDKAQLLRWLERTVDGRRDLLLAPIAETGAETDAIYNYIQKIQDEKRACEDSRLLYVAATRAKKRLHLLGGAGIVPKTGEIRKPAQKTLLNTLWPAVNEIFDGMAKIAPPEMPLTDESETENSENGEATAQIITPFIRRLSAAWILPAPPSDIMWPQTGKQAVPASIFGMPEFEWASDIARHVGNVVHRWLKVICDQGLENWSTARIEDMHPVFKADLIFSGAAGELIENAVAQVHAALINAVTDKRGNWILSRHTQGYCEYALTGMTDAGIVSVAMDRTFVDETGVRWIIDYKTGTHQGGSMDEFLDREQERYRAQLETYAKLMRATENREIRLGLYFPLMNGWREWATGS
jgi:ATP-dependent exoDNAse (exonuclease V) beta subunit